MVFDVRATEFTAEEAGRQIARYFGASKRGLESVEVIGKDYFITPFEYIP